jgi:predicted ATPase
MPDLSPQRRKRKTLEVLQAQLESPATRQPVLAIFEDVHWIDPSSLELLTLTVERMQHLPVLLVVTARPEFAPPWPEYAHVTTVPLPRLNRLEGTELIARMTDSKALPGEVLEQVLARADGIPLFIEELTRTVLESGLLRERSSDYVLRDTLPPLAIPSTLQASLTARIDKLPLVREVAQIGAAIGREFPFDLLRALAPMEEAALADALDQLVASQLVFRRGSAPDATYRFKHALVQEAAYDMLLRGNRRELHAHIVTVLETQFADVVEQQPEVLAHHCTRAGLPVKAVIYWSKAGRQSAARSAMIEAVRQLQKGLELLSSLPDGPERWRQELALQIDLSAALTASRGYSAPETGQAYARAHALCARLGDAATLIAVLSGQSTYHLVHASTLRRVNALTTCWNSPRNGMTWLPCRSGIVPWVSACTISGSFPRPRIIWSVCLPFMLPRRVVSLLVSRQLT